MRRNFMSAVAFLFAVLLLPAQENDSGFIKAFNNINGAVLKAQLGYLASDHMEGRKAGEKGEIISSDYIASQLQMFGVAPAGDSALVNDSDDPFVVNGRTYFQNFSIIRTTPGEDAEMTLIAREGAATRRMCLKNNVDFYIRYPDKTIEIEAPVVFAGYGFKSEKLKCNDFEKLDLRGKFVARISGYPGFALEKLTLPELAAASRDAESTARQMGAAGIIEINPESSAAGFRPAGKSTNPSDREQRPYAPPLTGSYRLAENANSDTFIKIYVSSGTGNELLKDSGSSLSEYISKSRSSYVSQLPAIKNKSITVKTDVRTEEIKVRNVIGIIEGRIKDQFIVLGAHYDHLGSSGGYIWNGADDNGSGTVGVMTIAKAIMETGIRPGKSVIIALWTAEEEGLLGSRYFVRNLPYSKNQIRLNMNFDMIGRHVSDDEPDKAVITYNGSLPILRSVTENNLKKYNIGLKPDFQPSDNPQGGSDHRSFAESGIPVFRIKPGHREEYHTPFDETRVIDWDIMEKIVRISFADAWELANTEW
ncbi:MAG TPA: M20/M25/M40 family metallo-hydrolase [Bacteroidales bacterium]|nr:M20/M25/M40 family metallo-hydrolase [Bacteroidales bacterium]